MSDSHFDAASEPPVSDGNRRRPRRFIGMTFACCQVYTRIYVNAEETAYMGHCPKCGKRVQVRIGPGGTGDRFFVAY